MEDLKLLPDAACADAVDLGEAFDLVESGLEPGFGITGKSLEELTPAFKCPIGMAGMSIRQPGKAQDLRIVRFGDLKQTEVPKSDLRFAGIEGITRHSEIHES